MNKSSIIIILSSIVFFIINEAVSYNIAIKEETEVSYKRDQQILTNLFDAQDEHLSVIAEVLSSDVTVIDSFIKNKPELISEHIGPIWKMLKSNKLIYQIHFFKPPAISFVNFLGTNSEGKDISEIRTDIKWVTSSLKESSHVLMCNMYAGYRTTEPIIDKNGTVLGALSLGRKVDWVPIAIKEDTKHDAFLVYSKYKVSTLKPKHYKVFMEDKELINDYILGNKTIDISAEELKDIDFKKEIQNVIINGEEYKLFSHPVVDFNKQTIAYLCTVSKLKVFNSRFINYTIKEILLILFTALILIYINNKRKKRVMRYIGFIQEMTEKIKNRDFKFLHNQKPIANEVGIDSLTEIKDNIIDMGLSLENHYLYLENDNKAKAEELISQFYRDELTGLGNRNALMRDLEKFNSSVLVLFNVRSFRSINDAFGLEAGNHILKMLSKIYISTSYYELKIYRINSDEFAIVDSLYVSKNNFLQVIKNTISKIENTTFKFKDIEMRINIYAGICLEDDRQLEKATIALDHSKENNLSYVIYDKKYDTKDIQIKNIETLNKITLALKDNKIVPYFQPIVDKNGVVHKYESLVRMIDGDKVLSPYFFLDISKKTKMYNEITKTMIEKTFEKFNDSTKFFSINITASDILNEEVVELIYLKLENVKNPQQVVLELVESDDLYHLEEIEIFLNKIKILGAKIAIDDFGTGYSNFSYMIKIKPDYLKIDGSLIKNIDTDVSAYKTVSTIINFGHDLGIKIIAEFIHNKEVFDICKNLGVDEFQGYYFSEPKVDIEL